MADGRVAIPGSAPVHPVRVSRSSEVASQAVITATVILRRRDDSDRSDQLLSGKFTPISREDAALQLGADPDEIAKVECFAKQFGLAVVDADGAKRSVKISGTAGQFDQAFGTTLRFFGDYISYQGPLTVPESLGGIVSAVLGLDNRPVAHPHIEAESV